MSDLQRHLSTTEPAETFSRTERLFGRDGMERLRQTRVILFGVGGVGSWCAEALVRTGVGHLTMVDPDIVAYSNINRQCPASTSTVGRHKVEVMRERLLDINPQADIVAMAERFTADDAERFALDSYDYVIDATSGVWSDITIPLSKPVSNGKLTVTFAGNSPTVKFYVIDDTETAGIQSIQQGAEQLATDNRYYTLSGQLCTQPGKGLYIINGKKVLIR